MLKTAGGVTILDDSYNSNLLGFTVALETLASFDGRKICVTPGIVECGKQASAINQEIGKKIADVCSLVFLVGGMAEELEKGLLEQKFDENNIIRCNTLSEAQGMFSEFLRAGDVVLLENDLPDNY